jgi:TM2 domain-containing membrane protein YozV
MAEVSTGKRSYLAMSLSALIPGLGQFYLRKPLLGIILFIGVISAGALIYMNSRPVNSWHDLTRIDRSEKNKNADYHLYTLKDGRKLMFHPSWKFKISGFIQGIVCWGYAIFDGWLGQRGFNRRAFKKRLKAAKEQREAAEGSDPNDEPTTG